MFDKLKIFDMKLPLPLLLVVVAVIVRLLNLINLRVICPKILPKTIQYTIETMCCSDSGWRMSSEIFQQFHNSLHVILQNIPYEWRGTTFKNSHLLGRETFSLNLLNLIQSNGINITTDDLINLGNAEDYLRVSSNISCILETYLAVKHGYSISQIFTFASRNLSMISVILTSNLPVHIFLGPNGVSPFTDEHLQMLSLLSGEVHLHQSEPTSQGDNVVILAYESASSDVFSNPLVDGIIGDGILYIKEVTKITPSKILTIRKRLSTPMTTPVAENMLRQFAGQSVETFEYTEEELVNFQSHLQVLSGTPVNLSCPPICYTAGLPAVCSIWMTLVAQGGADIVMASTAYGGSSELTDIISARAKNFKKHKFDITGQNEIVPAVQSVLSHLQNNTSELQPRTVLFIEIPTNPDMKVPNIVELATILLNYKRATGKHVLLLVDTTFAPGSQVLTKVESQFPELTTMVFISMSKSVSRGITTAGALIAGSSTESCELLHRVHVATNMFDTSAKPDQMKRLIDNHIGVEERCDKAYRNAAHLGNVLRETISQLCHGYNMPLAFVTEENAMHGFTSSTFSFNLPPISTHHAVSDPNKESEMNANLAQHFVDLLCNHPEEFKPCVSFGQDNGLVYATVPATSTQGAIHPDDKAKQAIGGVQLTRLSFPPTCDIPKLEEIIKKCVKDCYEVVV